MILTYAAATLMALALVIPLLFSDGSYGYFSACLTILAPFEIGTLLVLWSIYLSYPTLVISLFGARGVTDSHVSSKKKSSRNKKLKYVHDPRTWYLRILAYVVLLSTLCGIALVWSFAAVGGPNKGAGKHFFSGADLYLDVKIGILLIVLASILALVHYSKVHGLEIVIRKIKAIFAFRSITLNNINK